MSTKARPTILIVDDDQILGESVQSVLERQFPDSKVLRTDSAKGATEILGQQHVDVVLSDYQIAGEDGVDFLRQARRDNGDLRCILMTGFPAVGLAVRARREAGVDALAVKPFDAKQIVGLVKNVLAAPSKQFLYEAPT